MQEKRTWKRRNYFIKQDFQGRFILRFFLTILLSAVVFTIILSIFSAHTITITYRDSFEIEAGLLEVKKANEQQTGTKESLNKALNALEELKKSLSYFKTDRV